MLELLRSNMQSGILVLVIILLLILCAALFFTHREVRDLRYSTTKLRHEIEAIQSVLGEVGLLAMGNQVCSSIRHPESQAAGVDDRAQVKPDQPVAQSNLNNNNDNNDRQDDDDDEIVIEAVDEVPVSEPMQDPVPSTNVEESSDSDESSSDDEEEA